jgi:hypothetical protein
MALVTYADLLKPAVSKPTLKTYEIVKMRVHDKANPMPPASASALPAADMAVLDAWFDAGAQPGTTAADANCMVKTEDVVGGSADLSTGPLVAAPGETCYEFKNHQSTTMVDDQPYDVGLGEHYEQFYFKAPWPKGSVATAYGTRIDNGQVLHHWLLFGTNENEVEGFHKTAPLPTLLGLEPMLLAGWAVGGPNVVPPKDVAFILPEPGAQINIQYHFYNSTNTKQVDASALQICVVPAGTRPHIGNVTWLGSEDLGGAKWSGGKGMPPHMASTFTTTCNPNRMGVAADEPIHIIGFEPHMHRLGTNMTTRVNHKDGTSEVIFDHPFTFGYETHYFKNYDLLPGETLTTSCSFNNTTDKGVRFGESTDDEMCYQFTFAWPAHAMQNRPPSWIGVPDSCWGANIANPTK